MTENWKVSVLPEKLTVESIQESKEKITTFLKESGSKIRCDGSLVTALDGSGLQMLLVFYQCAIQAGKDFIIYNPSTVLQDGLRCSGVSKIVTMEV